MTKHAVSNAPVIVWRYCQPSHGFSRTDQKLSKLTSPLVESREYPTGCCIQAFVATMKKPDSQDPAKTRRDESQCPLGPRRLSPKRSNPKKLDSRKKEKTPSMARVWP